MRQGPSIIGRPIRWQRGYEKNFGWYLRRTGKYFAMTVEETGIEFAVREVLGGDDAAEKLDVVADTE